jgi:hypothetical protein
MVLVCGGRSERSYDRVADELLHGAARSFDFRCHRVVEAIEQEPCSFGVLLGAELGRADEIRKQDRRQLSLPTRGDIERPPALRLHRSS